MFEGSSGQDEPSQVHSFCAWTILSRNDSSETKAGNARAHTVMLVPALHRVEGFFSELQEHLSIASFGDKMTPTADFNEDLKGDVLGLQCPAGVSGSSAVRQIPGYLGEMTLNTLTTFLDARIKSLKLSQGFKN